MTDTQSRVFVSDLGIVPKDPQEPIAEIDALAGCFVNARGLDETCDAP